MIRLDAAAGDEGVGAIGNGPGGNERELPDLVAAEAEGEGVVPLGEQPCPDSQRLAKTGQLVDGRGKVAETD
jgi:hypothetical protein